MTPPNQPLEPVVDGNAPPEMLPPHSHHVTATTVLHGASESSQYEWFSSLADLDFADMSWLSAVPGALLSDPE